MTSHHSPVGSNGMSVRDLCRRSPRGPAAVWSGRGGPCKIAFDHLEKFGCSVIPYGRYVWIPKIWDRWSPAFLAWGMANP